jgi:hypothetical protein
LFNLLLVLLGDTMTEVAGVVVVEEEDVVVVVEDRA